MTSPIVTEQWLELATRENDGLSVCLWWCRTTGEVKVTFLDTGDLTLYECEGVEPDKALDAFYHPYMYLPS